VPRPLAQSPGQATSPLCPYNKEDGLDSLILYLLYAVIGGTLLVAFNPFKRTADSFRVNPLGAVPTLLLLFVVLYGMQLQGWRQWQAGVLLTVGFGWFSYFFLMCRYSYDGQSYRWFNGLWRRSVQAGSVRRIIWRRDKRRIAKVRFECDDRTLNTRTDMPDVVRLLKQMAEDYHIETKTEHLPWWSV
jgi:hypothetical protein